MLTQTKNQSIKTTCSKSYGLPTIIVINTKINNNFFLIFTKSKTCTEKRKDTTTKRYTNSRKAQHARKSSQLNSMNTTLHQSMLYHSCHNNRRYQKDQHLPQ